MSKTIFVVANRDYPSTLKACEVLKPNYNLITSVNPVEALDYLRGSYTVDLLIADGNLKADDISNSMSGEEFITQAHVYKPEMPAIYIPSKMMSSDLQRSGLMKIIDRMRHQNIKVDYIAMPITDKLEAKVKEMTSG